MILFSYLKQFRKRYSSREMNVSSFRYLLSAGWGSFYKVRGRRARRLSTIKHYFSRRWRR